MAIIGQEKYPAETIQLTYNFSRALLTGETVPGAGYDISVENALTGVDVTSTIKVTGSDTITSTTMACRVQAGSAGDIYIVKFLTGTTNFSRILQGTIRLLVTDQPLSDNTFCSVSEVKQYLKIDPLDTSDDSLIEMMVMFATRYLTNRIARPLVLDEHTETVYIDECSDSIRLNQYPIVSIDEIVIYTDLGGVYQTITDTTAYDFASQGYLFFRHTYEFPEFPYYTVVRYHAGYSAIPEDLREAAIQIVATSYRVLGKEGLSSERIGDYMWQAPNASSKLTAEIATPKVEAVITRYRRMDFSTERCI